MSNLKDVIASVANESEESKKKIEDLVQLVVFRLDNEEYGVEISDLQEIIRISKVTPLPNAPAFIRGILNLRGKIVVVVDLEERFNLNREEKSEESKHIIIIQVAENNFGVIVDMVEEVLRVPVSTIRPVPALVSAKIHSEYLRGVVVLEEEKETDKAVKKETENELVVRKKKRESQEEKIVEKKTESRLIILLDLPKILQEGELLSLGKEVKATVESVKK